MFRTNHKVGLPPTSGGGGDRGLVGSGGLETRHRRLYPLPLRRSTSREYVGISVGRAHPFRRKSNVRPICSRRPKVDNSKVSLSLSSVGSDLLFADRGLPKFRDRRGVKVSRGSQRGPVGPHRPYDLPRDVPYRNGGSKVRDALPTLLQKHD